MTDTEKQIKIKSFLDDFKTEFQNSNIVKHTAFKSLVVIGSYADWIKNPNSNISPSWKSSLPEFYEKHYGPKAKEIILKILSYESNYFECRKTIPIKTFLKDFSDLKNIIYTKGFLNRLNELHLSDNNFLKVLPLWY